MDVLFLKLLNLSITASWMVLGVLVLRLVFRRAPKWLFCVLWGLVGLRLICPISIESTFSLVPNTETIAEEYLFMEPPEYNIEAEVNVADNPSLPDILPLPLDTSADQVQVKFIWWALLWPAGCAAMFLYTFISWLLLWRKVATATILEKNIKQSDQVDSPFVLGILKPTIYLPYRLEQKDIPFVIAHEQAHIRRKDHWWKPIGFLILSVYWFNPILWVGYIFLCRDIETACDEKVIRKMERDGLRDYSMALLNCSVHRRRIAGCPLAFGEAGVKTRIKNVMNYKKPAFWIIAAAAIASIVLAVCFLTDPAKPGLGKPVKNLAVAEAQLPNDMELRLVLKQGSCFSQEEAAAGGGVYPENYQGEYVLQVWHSDTLVSELKQDAFLSLSADGQTLNFEPGFEISLADYNGDGNSDFALGQWLSGSHNIYQLFSVDKNGSLSVLPVNRQLIASSHEFSPLFPISEPGSFSFEQYDTGSGTFINCIAKWDGKSFAVESLAAQVVGEEKALVPGTAYVSWQCLYINPLSSYAAIGGDSGCRYLVLEDSFTTITRSTGAQNIIEVSKWEWQEFPYSEEEWEALCKPGGSGHFNIIELYDEIRYQPLNAGKFLLLADGNLLVVELASNNEMGTYLWSVYSLVQETAMGSAQWEYAPIYSSRFPVFRFEFDMEYEEISAVCTEGSLVDFNETGISGSSMMIPEGKCLWWSPAVQNGDTVSDAEIYFTVQNEGIISYAGTICLTVDKKSGTFPTYTATIIGTGLHMNQNTESEGGVISVAVK